MKKFFFIAALAGAFVAFTAQTSVAQTTNLKNATNCPALTAVIHGNPFTCTANGYLTTTVAAMTAVTPYPGLPAGDEILYGKGTVNGVLGCGAWYIGIPCSPYPPTDVAPCGPCGVIIADMLPTYGIYLHY